MRANLSELSLRILAAGNHVKQPKAAVGTLLIAAFLSDVPVDAI